MSLTNLSIPKNSENQTVGDETGKTSNTQTKDPTTASDLLIIHGGDKYLVPLFSDSDETITVKELAHTVEELSGVPKNSQRLIYKGRSLTNMDAALSSYGVTSGSKIMLLGSRPNVMYQSEELRVIGNAEHSVSNLETKMKQVSNQIAELEKGYLPRTSELEVLHKLSKELKMINEEFMQTLEKLDSMSLAESEKEIKLKRKSVVDVIQILIQRNDRISENIEMMISKNYENS